jgi:penicillin G amidase
LARIIVTAAAIFLALVTVIGAIAYFAFGAGTGFPSTATVPDLSGRATVTWLDEGLVRIEAETDDDLDAAVGFVHGLDHTWTIVLWRQAALGRLSEFFGEEVVRFDVSARQAGFARHARASYSALDETTRRSLEAYTSGVNAALGTRRARLTEELSLLRVEPEPWQPWHTLAIEQMLAWIGADLADLRPHSPDMAAFFEAQEEFRYALHLFGFHQSSLWTAPADEGRAVFHRHVFGDSALRFLQEIEVHGRDGDVMIGATLPGTPYFLSGSTSRGSWSLLLSSVVRAERRPLDDSELRTMHERITDHEGREHLATFEHFNGSIVFRDPPLPPPPPPPPPVEGDTLAVIPAPAPERPPVVRDSITVVIWSNDGAVSDAASWRLLREQRTGAFRLLRGDGLIVNRDGSWSVTGSPRHVISIDGGVVVSNDLLAPGLARSVDFIDDREPNAPGSQRWPADTYSAWAAEVLPGMLAGVDSLFRGNRGVDAALPYLRNWDYRFDRTSIAATIFDRWISRFYQMTGRLPAGHTPAPSGDDHIFYHQALAQVAQMLNIDREGDHSDLRWEVTTTERLYYPFSGDATSARTALSIARYAPLTLGGRGHPTSVYWSPSAIHPGRPANASWAAWTILEGGQEVHFRRRRIAQDTFLARQFVPDRPSEPVRLPAELGRRTTILTP